jgi:hypothetical protein
MSRQISEIGDGSTTPTEIGQCSNDLRLEMVHYERAYDGSIKDQDLLPHKIARDLVPALLAMKQKR